MRAYSNAMCLALVLSSCAALDSDALTSAELAAIRNSSSEYVAAMQANDWSSVASYFTEDTVRMPPNLPMQIGREAVEASFAPVEEVSQYTVVIDSIRGGAGYAYVIANYSIQLTLRGVGEPIEDSGKAIEVWRLDEDGQWRMASAIWNSGP